VNTHLLSISFAFLFFPLFHDEKNIDSALPEEAGRVGYLINDNSTLLYNELELSSLGLSKQAFDYAYKGYKRLVEKKKLNNPAILTICDLSQSSDNKRLYILDLSENKVLLTSYVAHGRGSGVKYATRFSNNARSHQSSLGFYITGSSYNGQNGLALRLTGLEKGFNNLASNRHIVIHGAGYVSDEYLQTNKFMGRSYGCPAVSKEECSEIINLIKDGTCLFIYHPTKKYLTNSKILND
jgi:hypothetical protein